MNFTRSQDGGANPSKSTVPTVLIKRKRADLNANLSRMKSLTGRDLGQSESRRIRKARQLATGKASRPPKAKHTLMKSESQAQITRAPPRLTQQVLPSHLVLDGMCP